MSTTMSMFATVGLLIVSNIFMTCAWYGHLKLGEAGITSNWPLIGVILLSWGIALMEYMCQVPANRIGFEGNGGPFSIMQLKVIQEVLTLIIFVIFCTIAFKGFQVRWNHLVAFLLLIGAVCLVFMNEETSNGILHSVTSFFKSLVPKS